MSYVFRLCFEFVGLAFSIAFCVCVIILMIKLIKRL